MNLRVNEFNNATDTTLHLVVVGGLDPTSDDTWSGTPKALISALRAAGHRVSTVGPLQNIDTSWPRLKAWGHSIVGKAYFAIRDPAVVRRRTTSLASALRALEPYDAVIAWHAGDAAIVNAVSPLIFVHDATWRQLLDFYPRYARSRLPRSMIERGEELDRAALKNCARAIFSSHWATTAAQIEYATPAHKLRVHPFGPNLPIIPTDDELRQAIEKRGQAPCRLIFVGVDWGRKGGDMAIAVASRLNDQGIACQLDIVGADPPKSRPNWVRAHGFLPRKDPAARSELAALLLAADFLILPTRADCSPIVLSEAAAYGLPVVTTAVGGIPETIGETGWAKAFPVDARDELFADWIAHVFRDRAHYERLAWLGRREHASRLNWPDFARTLIGTVRELQGAAAPTAKPAEQSA